MSGVEKGMRGLLASRSEEMAAGASAVGWKIGINVPALQAHFGLEGPVVGYLTDRTVLPVGQPVDVSGWVHPALEVELAIRVGEVGEIAGLAAAVELVDLDLPFDDIEPILTGNVFHRRVIFGEEVRGLELTELDAIVTVAGQVVARGTLRERPWETVELVKVFLNAHGAALSPGDRIIAGSLIAPMAVGPGDRIDIKYGPLGSIRVDIS